MKDTEGGLLGNVSVAGIYWPSLSLSCHSRWKSSLLYGGLQIRNIIWKLLKFIFHKCLMNEEDRFAAPQWKQQGTWNVFLRNHKEKPDEFLAWYCARLTFYLD